MKKVLFLYLSLFLALSAAATEHPSKGGSTLKGVVKEMGTGDGLTGVRVQVVGTEIFTFTDRDGHFELPICPSHNCQISYSLVSFQTTVITASEISDELMVDLVPR